MSLNVEAYDSDNLTNQKWFEVINSVCKNDKDDVMGPLRNVDEFIKEGTAALKLKNCINNSKKPRKPFGFLRRKTNEFGPDSTGSRLPGATSIDYSKWGGINTSTTTSNTTAIHFACSIGNIYLLNLLITNGAQVDVFNSSLEAPFIMAVRGGHVDIIHRLMQLGVHKEDIRENKRLLVSCCSRNNYEMLKFLIEDCEMDPGYIVAETQSTLLHYAALGNSYEICNYLKGKPKIYDGLLNKDGKTPCELATDPKVKAILTRMRFKNLGQCVESVKVFTFGHLDLSKLEVGSEQYRLMTVNFLDLFGIDENSQLSELKKSYRKLCIKWHPDKNPGFEVLFSHIADGYQILCDPVLKREYLSGGYRKVQDIREREATSGINEDNVVNEGDIKITSFEDTFKSDKKTKKDTDATINGTDATINDTDATINDTDATINDTDATINDTDATINDTDATINDTDATINDTGNYTSDVDVGASTSASASTSATINGTSNIGVGVGASANATINDTKKENIVIIPECIISDVGETSSSNEKKGKQSKHGFSSSETNIYEKDKPNEMKHNSDLLQNGYGHSRGQRKSPSVGSADSRSMLNQGQSPKKKDAIGDFLNSLHQETYGPLGSSNKYY